MRRGGLRAVGLRTRLASLLVTGLVLAGCGGSPGPSFPSFPPFSFSLATPQPVGTPHDCALTGGDLEGCFAFEDMDVFLDEEAEEHARTYFGAMYADISWWPEVEYIPTAMTVPSDCTDSEGNRVADAETFAYCSVNEKVLIGQDSLWQIYAAIGDAAAVAGFIHEMGHHLQALFGVHDLVETRQQQIDAENQADCVAGSWAAWAGRQGILNEADDLGDLGALIVAIGDAETDPTRIHGTVTERTNAFTFGQREGLFGCNGYFPSAPLITPADG